MDVMDDIERIVRSAKSSGLSMRAACMRAGIHPTTVSRWKGGDTKPMLETLRKLEAVIASASGKGQRGESLPMENCQDKHSCRQLLFDR